MQITVISLRWINGSNISFLMLLRDYLGGGEFWSNFISYYWDIYGFSLSSQVCWSFLLRCWRLLQNFDLFSISPLIFLLFSWGWGFRRTDWPFFNLSTDTSGYVANFLQVSSLSDFDFAKGISFQGLLIMFGFHLNSNSHFYINITITFLYELEHWWFSFDLQACLLGSLISTSADFVVWTWENQTRNLWFFFTHTAYLASIFFRSPCTFRFRRAEWFWAFFKNSLSPFGLERFTFMLKNSGLWKAWKYLMRFKVANNLFLWEADLRQSYLYSLFSV